MAYEILQNKRLKKCRGCFFLQAGDSANAVCGFLLTTDEVRGCSIEECQQKGENSRFVSKRDAKKHNLTWSLKKGIDGYYSYDKDKE